MHFKHLYIHSLYIPIVTLLVTMNLLTATFAQGQSNTDSLEVAINKTTDRQQQLTMLLDLTRAYLKTDPDKAMTAADRGLEMARKGSGADIKAQFLTLKGNIYQMQAQYPEAHQQLDQALEVLEGTTFEKQLAEVLIEKARIYQHQGLLDNAMETYLKAVKNYEHIKNEIGVAQVYAGISDCLYFKEEYAEGAEYGERAIALLKKNNTEDGLIIAYKATTNNFIGTKNYGKAYELISEALNTVSSQSMQGISRGSLHNTRGNALKHLGRYEEAIKDYEISNRIAQQFKHPAGISATAANIADVYMRMGKYAEALPYKQDAVRIMEEHDFKSNLMENYGHIITIYKELGNYPQAFHYSEKLFTLRDSMMSIEKGAITEELRTKYETEKNEATIATQAQRLVQQRRVQLLVIAAAVLLGLMLFQTYRNFRIKKRTGEKLSTANALLEKRNTENELLLKEIHHRVKNNLQIVSSLLNLQSESISDQVALDAVGDSQHRVRSMALIHQKLYLNENLASIEMLDYFETMGEAILQSFGSRAALINYKVQMEKLELDIDTAIPIGLITNELITNSLKHAFPDGRKGMVTVGLAKYDDHELVLSVSDDGVPESNGNATGTGFGTQLVQLLAAQLNGRIVRSLQHGTNIELYFPKPESQSA